METFDPHLFVFDRLDWERIKRALIAYTASLEHDRSGAAFNERQDALALYAEIANKL